jgi:nucleoside-triphosphatase THEP1
MVKIVTGDMDSGKTTRIYSLFEQNKHGDGFIQLKTMQENKVHHYDVLFLKNNIKKTIAYHQSFYEEQFKIPIYLGPYLFDQEIFNEIYTLIDMMIEKNITPIYLDEIGMLEINQKGYAPVLRKLIEKDIDIIIAVKESLIFKVVHTFDIKKYEIIR